MAGEVVGTNLVLRPRFENGGGESDAWRVNGGGQAAVKGRDARGNPFYGLQVKKLASGAVPTASPHVSIGTYDAGTVFQFETAIKAMHSTEQKMIIGVVPTLGSNNAGTDNFAEVMAPALGTSDSVGEVLTGSFTALTTGEQFLRLHSLGTADIDCLGVRVYEAATADEYGIFDGDTADTEALTYEWTADPYMSPSTVSTPDPGDDNGGDPPPAGEPSDLGKRVAAHLGRAGDEDTELQATAHAEIVTDYVWGYTRGKGFTDDVPVRPLRSVIVAATARLTGNPEQLSYYVAGDYSEKPAILAGWLLHELAVMNNYRRRYA